MKMLTCFFDDAPEFDDDDKTNILESVSGRYGSRWGLDDMYPETEEVLRSALDSDKDFYARWGAKKEIVWCEVERTEGEVFVTVTTSIDDLADLVDTLIWEAAGGNDVCDSGFDYICQTHDLDPDVPYQFDFATKIMEEIEGWVEDVYQQTFRQRVGFEFAPDYDKVMQIANELWDACNRDSSAKYDELLEMIKEGFDAVGEQERMARECRPG